MRFAAPGYLWLLLGLPLLPALFVVWRRRRQRLLRIFGDLPLLRRLSTGTGLERQIVRLILLSFAALFLILALARPQWGSVVEQVARRGVDVIVAVDTSPSMLAEDVKPNRMTQARAAVLQLLDMLRGDRIGLVAFSGAADVTCPLTLDYAAAALFVDVLDTDLIPVKGTAIAQAIRVATAAFESSERRYKVLILITDGEDHEGDVEAAARAAAAEGVIIHAVGIGSASGEPIPLRNAHGDVTGYKEDGERRKVTTRLDETTLASIAAATGGRYFRSTPEGLELHRVYEEIARMDQRTMSGRLQTAFEERYPIPLGIAVLLFVAEAAISDRRRDQPGRGAAGEEAT